VTGGNGRTRREQEIVAGMTGAEIKAAIEREAHRKGVSAMQFAAPLSRWPDKWLHQLGGAQRPKPATIVRVKALLAGEQVPPAPANNFWKHGSDPTRRAARADTLHRVSAGPAAGALPPPVDRDPCFRCGTRGDLGCSHRRNFEGVQHA
jgi:hypothetical protein